jgi:hypothetical protein
MRWAGLIWIGSRGTGDVFFTRCRALPANTISTRFNLHRHLAKSLRSAGQIAIGNELSAWIVDLFSGEAAGLALTKMVPAGSSVHGGNPSPAVRRGTLDRLDPGTGAPQRRYEIAPGTEGIAFGNAGRLWAVSEAGSRHIYDHPFLDLFRAAAACAAAQPKSRPLSLRVSRIICHHQRLGGT